MTPERITGLREWCKTVVGTTGPSTDELTELLDRLDMAQKTLTEIATVFDCGECNGDVGRTAGLVYCILRARDALEQLS